jgi:hypothetical protein
MFGVVICQGQQALTFVSRPDLIAGSKLETLRPIFEDDKATKQVLNAAKRSGKKRAAPEDEPAPAKRQRKSQFELRNSESTEALLVLPEPSRDETKIAKAVLFTNRAPLVLAFGVVLLKYTMPEQPLSSRLSLAQAAVSMNSRSKAVHLGIEKGKSAEEEGWGMGQVKVNVMGREVRTMKRMGWGNDDEVAQTQVKKEDIDQTQIKIEDVAQTIELEKKPAYWALDLEALKKHNGGFNDGTGVGFASAGLPIYSPQSARSYLMKSFTTRVDPANRASKGRGQRARQIDENVSLLLGALELLFESWCDHLTAHELDIRAWGWYVEVRPSVADGVSGWGAKGELKLADILCLRRKR